MASDAELTDAVTRIELHPHYSARPTREVRTDSLAYRWVLNYDGYRDAGQSHEDAARAMENAICKVAGMDPMWVTPPPPEGVTLPRLVVHGQMFMLEDGTPWTAVQTSDFNLLNRWQHGDDIAPVLTQRRDAGFNMLRVWTLYDLAAAKIGVFLDIDYARIPAFMGLCGAYGLYVEFTAYTSTERQDHWDRLTAALQGTSALLELVNEGTLPVNQIDMARYRRPSDILASHGSGGSEGVPPWEPWDYVTFHTNGSNEEQRKVGHNAWEIWNGPTLTNETSRYPDVGMWDNAKDLSRCRQLAFDSAAGAALLCAGSCFHSAAGKSSQLWDASTLDVARAWANGAKSVPLACQHEPYYHRTELETEDLLRVYQRGSAPSNIVRIRT